MLNFKKNYEKGEVTLPDGSVIKVMELPIESLVTVAVDGFILRCQDHCKSEKKRQERKKDAALKMANKLVSGAFSREREYARQAREYKLEKLEACLEDFIRLSDDEKRCTTRFKVSRSRTGEKITHLKANNT